ncbi:MAG: GntP family permease [Bacteroidota bacterium]|nr:GntP family permease [Bacteroidota bacterium]MDP4212981.1 GntP family permease [Bacteroidota bacterium]MDP4250803.1 GntP family permease [Bacteroidota bacterium]
MENSFLYLFVCLLAGISIIVLLTAKYKVHAFFALIIACFVVGLGVHLPLQAVVDAVKNGFGDIMKSLGLIIVFGTALGVLLEHNGSTRVMASFILKRTGDRYAALAMSIAGFLVGLPIFCDSGYIVLSGLNRTLAKRTGISMVIMSTSLATGLYSIHCLIPPHPGAAAAAGILGVDYGKLIMMGLFVAVPAALTGHLWANYAGKNTGPLLIKEEMDIAEDSARPPSVIRAFLPVIVPIALIAIKSFFVLDPGTGPAWLNGLLETGDPVIALAIGLLLAIHGDNLRKKGVLPRLLQDAAEKAGSILVIIGAGGAFGAVLASTGIGKQFGSSGALIHLGVLFPFLLAFILKTAQGSSTVAIITAASIIQPLLPALGLNTETGKLFCILAMGAGSMMISHANDAYFWVIARFSGLDMKTMLKVYSVATFFMGMTAMIMVYLLKLLFLH